MFTKLMVNTFAQESVTAPGILRELRECDNYEFLDEALRALLERILDPNFLSAAEAIQVARRMQELDRTTDIQLMRRLNATTENPNCRPGEGMRALEILEGISDGKRILTLSPNLLHHSDNRVRSKAALLIGHFNQNLAWIGQQLKDSDARVRANAVESLWGAEAHEASSLFLQATEDSNHRVAGNGIVGLHRAGELTSARIAQSMSKHSDPVFRSAAAWAMGETDDPRFLPLLKQMLAETEGAVRRNALRATVRIRKRLVALQACDTLRVTAQWRRDRIQVSVWSSEGVFVPNLPATAFVVEFAEMISVNPISQYYDITLGSSPEQETWVSVHATCGVGRKAVYREVQPSATVIAPVVPETVEVSTETVEAEKAAVKEQEEGFKIFGY